VLEQLPGWDDVTQSMRKHHREGGDETQAMQATDLLLGSGA
jgi:hypothetical protein